MASNRIHSNITSIHIVPRANAPRGRSCFRWCPPPTLRGLTSPCARRHRNPSRDRWENLGLSWSFNIPDTSNQIEHDIDR